VSGAPLRVVINGEARELPAVGSVAALLAQLGLDPRRVVVERNRTIVRRGDLDATPVSDGDRIEIVHFVGGG
jgi:thiamine biosynthesis protein ThiS